MLRWLSFIPLAFALALPAKAQDAATLGKLPEVHVMTALKSGDWDDFGDKINEAFEEVEEQADDRNIKLADAEVVIYEVIGLKTFRIRAGYLIDPASKVKPGRVGKNMEVRLLKGPAYVATGVGGYKASIPIRRKVLDELEKPNVRRLKGIETIEIFYGDMDDKDTKIEVYGPLR